MGVAGHGPELVEPPLVSVIVPTRNAARTLRACLESVRTQDYPSFELIVVDNDSDDGSFEIARELAHWTARGGSERSAQRNIGVAAARGEFVLWIDSDMVLDRDVVRRAVETALDTGAVGVSLPEVTVGPGFWTRCRSLERSCYLGDVPMSNPRLLRRAYLVEALRGFATDMAGPEDADLRLRMQADDAPVAYCWAFITHDEGRLTLRSVLAKRVYYGRSLPAFRSAHPGGLSRQFSGTVGAFVRHRRRLARHPLLTAGIVVMRSAESVAYGVGAWQGRRRIGTESVG